MTIPIQQRRRRLSKVRVRKSLDKSSVIITRTTLILDRRVYSSSRFIISLSFASRQEQQRWRTNKWKSSRKFITAMSATGKRDLIRRVDARQGPLILIESFNMKIVSHAIVPKFHCQWVYQITTLLRLLIDALRSSRKFSCPCPLSIIRKNNKRRLVVFGN